MAVIHRPSIIGFFEEPDDLMAACAQARHEGFKQIDAYSPYPMHGIEEAIGIKRSWIPRAALAALIIGATLGFIFQTWTHSYDWPINIGGRPFFAWPAYIVITFESGVLICGLTTLLSLLVACRLYPNPFTKPLDPDLTNDRFALLIPAKTEELKDSATELLIRMGADEIRTLEK